MSKIHVSAIIEDGAKIADDVEIGPFCIIGPKVTIGSGSKLYSNIKIIGNTTIGKNNQFHHCTAIGDFAQDTTNPPDDRPVIIGDNNVFREYNTVHRPAKEDSTTIGSDNYFMIGAHIAHDCKVGNHIYIANYTSLGGHVHLNDYAYLSANIGIHQFCHIGQYAMIGACSKVAQDVPPFTMGQGTTVVANGLNIVAMKRAGFNAQQRMLVKRIFKVMFVEKLPFTKAKKIIEEDIYAEVKNDIALLKVINLYIDFFKNMTRGIISYAASPKKN